MASTSANTLESAPTDEGPSRFRARRTHLKSRLGCLRCKQQRKKCDEAKPSCTRCAARNYDCHYLVAPKDMSSPRRDHSPSSAIEDSYSATTAFNMPSSTASDSYSLSLSSSSIDPRLESLSPFPGVQGGDEPNLWAQESRSSDLLCSTDLALLTHYLMHTSRVVPYDEDDFYVLHVGIPNLAFSSKPVMSSLLALTASCESYDTFKRSADPFSKLNTIRTLLALADQHHNTALQHIQASISSVDSSSDILANAALMVLYASSSHCVRVHLANLARSSNQMLPPELMPAQSQWISLIRAAFAAYDGIVGRIDPFLESQSNTPEGNHPDNELPRLAGGGPQPSGSFISQDGPCEGTKRLFMPLVTSTCKSALSKLQDKADQIAFYEGLRATTMSETMESDEHSHVEAISNVDIQTCLSALEVLDAVTATFLRATNDYGSPNRASTRQEIVSHARLSHVPKWLSDYMARVTSAVPSLLLRRSIMSFLNKVPIEFLNFIQSVLDILPVEGRWKSRALDSRITWVPSVTQVLAMNIFAHWLVLVVLLDGVWWIGGIGEWELERVVALMRNENWLDLPSENDERWWPESMLKMKQELADHIRAM
ncbi:hypothetical protein B0I35DRAFT_483698 [Stachybotrys elegans]|uniref:Zn(2)-C6 fungal-type domain-containing protein n=1 Tax=Stachybotrys elegans TaxID=80388 RepID=A0A8K0SBV7_9HYPO|nr:hypothetical protein B0I35DRAFT_483698 [Stachybotrys elegans]